MEVMIEAQKILVGSGVEYVRFKGSWREGVVGLTVNVFWPDISKIAEFLDARQVIYVINEHERSSVIVNSPAGRFEFEARRPLKA